MSLAELDRAAPVLARTRGHTPCLERVVAGAALGTAVAELWP